MKLLLVSWGRGLGHVTRCLAIAAATHSYHGEIQVYMMTDSRCLTLAEQLGCTVLFFPENMESMNPWDNWHNKDYVKQSLEADLQMLETVKPDVVLHDLRPTIPLACELANIPCVMIAQREMYPNFFYPGGIPTYSQWDRMLPAFQEVLAQYKLQLPEKDLREVFCRHSIIIPSIPEFDPWPMEMTTQAWHTGPLLLSTGNTSCVPALDQEGQLPVIFVYGVVQSQADMHQLIEAFRQSSFHLLITGISNKLRLVHSDEYTASQITIYPFVDVMTYLPKCAAAIIHGGHGSCMAALASGVPTIVLPGFAKEVERRYNGRLLESMGIAKCVPGEIDWSKVPSEITFLLREPACRANASRWQKRMQKMKGASHALEILTRLAT